jgi:hypothetical protein
MVGMWAAVAAIIRSTINALIAESVDFVISNICRAIGSQLGPTVYHSLSSVRALAGARVGPVVDQTWTQLYTLGPIRVCHLVSLCESMGLLEPIMGPIDQPQCGFTWATCRAYIGPRHMDIFN